MNRSIQAYLPAAIAICIALCAAAALLLLGSARPFGAALPGSPDDGSGLPRQAASYLQRKAIDKGKQAVAPAHLQRLADEMLF